MNIKGLYIDRRMLGILAVFVFLSIILVSSLIIATNTLSGLRAFSTLQTYWTEARKDGAFELVRYLENGNEVHLTHYDKSLELIRIAADVRNELISASPNTKEVRDDLLAIHTHPRDADNMIKIFIRFHSFEHLSRAVEIWEEANNVIAEMEEIHAELSNYAGSGTFAEIPVESYINRILELDELLDEQADAIAVNLSDGSKMVTNFIFIITTILGSALIIAGFWLAYRLISSIKEWGSMMDYSEQLYKSLFEQNPNIVFSLTTDGFIKSGNAAFLELTGYPEEDLHFHHFNDFPISGDTKEFEKQFRETLHGSPQNFDLKWNLKQGEDLHLVATVLPIQIDGNIEGVFVIAEDVTFKKYAENKIKSQLDEKISLLAEIHDRVKNNLALISSLLYLQGHYLEDEAAVKYLESTISRIQSLAMIHERLYQAENFSSVRMDEFIRELVTTIKKSHAENDTVINLVIHAHPVKLDIKQAVPCGLLLNELIVNAFQYAFEGRARGTIQIELAEQDNHVSICVKDDGIGLPSNFDLDHQKTLGLTMVRLLSKQLNGNLKIDRSSGTEFSLQFNSNIQKLKSA